MALDYSSLEFFLVPCNYIHQYMGYTGDSVADECVANLKEQIDYLGSLDLLLYFNDEQYDVNEYGDQAIRRESKIIKQMINVDRP